MNTLVRTTSLFLLLLTAVSLPLATSAEEQVSQTTQTLGQRPNGKYDTKVTLIAGAPGASLLNSSTLLTGIGIFDTGTAAASNVTVTSITLSAGTLIFPSLPLNLGSIAVNGEALLHANFSGAFLPGGQYTLSVNGAYQVGAATYSFALNQLLQVPPASPGSASMKTSIVGSQFVSGAPFPPLRQPINAHSARF